MSALLPITTAKADWRNRSCPLYARKRTCAAQLAMSAKGQKQTCAAHGSCPPRAKGGSHFKGCWAGKLVICDHVTGFLIIAAVGGGSKCTEARYVQATSNPVCCKPFVMERSESNFLFRAYVFANASAASEAIIGRRLGNLAMGSV